MSMYASMAAQGISAIHVATGGDNAGTIAAFNESYGRASAKYAQLDKINAAESNISAIQQDKILTNTQIKMSQEQAEAMAKVNAAAAGVSGGSVDAVMQGFAGNAAMARQRAEAKAAQLTEQQKAGINSAFMTYKGIPDNPDSNPIMTGLTAGINAAIEYRTGGSNGVSNVDQGKALGNMVNSLWSG